MNEPPFDFHPTRQYRAALIARGYFVEAAKSIPEWKKQVALMNRVRQGILEPPIMELITSLGYRVAGGERLWIPRLLSSIFWLIGGALLYLLARKLVSTDAAVFSTAFYLFLPFGVAASRSFQPDPLMVMLFLYSICVIFQYHVQPSIPRLVIGATVSALAIFIKPVCLFAIFGAFVSLNISREGILKTLTNLKLLLFVGVSLLPTLAFYVYGIFIAGFLLGQAQGSFLPHLLFSAFFWEGWLNLIRSVVGYTAVIGALLGVVLMLGPGLPRALLIGLWIGYIVFGLVFTYHLHTHDYYHLQLVPIVALSLGPISRLIEDRLSQTGRRGYWDLCVVGAVLFVVLLSISHTQRRLINTGFESQVSTAQEIGEVVGHSAKTIFLSSNYGKPLQYYGELSGLSWPTSDDFRAYRLQGFRVLSAKEHLESLIANDRPEYFIVTDFEEFEFQEDLKQLLTKEFSLIVKKQNFVVFDLRKRIDADKE